MKSKTDCAFGGNVSNFKEENNTIEFDLNFLPEVGISVSYLNQVYSGKNIIMLVIDNSNVKIRIS